MLIFVYGTLMRGECRAGALREQRFVAEARTFESYRLYDCGRYPGLVETDDGHSVEGELWDVDESCLQRLDRIEAVDEGLYVRAPVRLVSPHAGADVQTYLYAQSIDGLRDCGVRWHQPL